MRAVHFSFSPEATLHRRHCLLLFVSAVLFFAASTVFAQSMTVSTVVGSTAGGGYLDGNGTNARFSYPRGVAVDSTGIVYVSDNGNHVIRRITPSGEVSTLAGQAGTQGSADGTGSAARFNFPSGLAIDLNDNVIVADTDNHTIRKITPAGVVTTIAGSAGKSGTTDGDGAAARFLFPRGVAVDQSGFIYVADTSNHTIRRIAGPNGTVTTFVGVPAQSGYDDGFPGSEIPAKFIYPFDLAVDANGDLYVADTYAHEIRKVTREKVVTTIAGDGFDPDSVDGAGTVARFQYPESIDVAPNGDIWIADTVNDEIRKMTPQGVVTTMAGVPNAVGVRNGALSQARFTRPTGLVFDRSGNLYIADHGNMVVRKVSTSLNVTTLAGNTPVSGGTDGFVSDARFFLPNQLAFDHLGNVFLTDSANTIRKNLVRKITSSGTVSTLAGRSGSSGSADGTGTNAFFDHPAGVTVAPDGSIFVADQDNHTIRRITAAGVVTTPAGRVDGPGNVDGSGRDARLYLPASLTADSTGRIWISDWYNHAIKIASFAPPTIPSFTATPSLIANPGPVTLSWSTTNATSVVITPNLGADVGSVPTSGTKVVNVTQTTRYTLVATGPGGTASAIVTVYVGSGPPRRRPSH
jgi:streptogramin lyase